MSVSSWESERSCIGSRGVDFASFWNFLLHFGSVPTIQYFLYFHFSSSDTQQVNIKIIQINCTKKNSFCLKCNWFLERVGRYQRALVLFSDNHIKHASSKQHILDAVYLFYIEQVLLRYLVLTFMVNTNHNITNHFHRKTLIGMVNYITNHNITNHLHGKTLTGMVNYITNHNITNHFHGKTLTGMVDYITNHNITNHFHGKTLTGMVVYITNPWGILVQQTR